MFNFDEAKVLQEHKNGLSIVGATEKAVDEVVKSCLLYTSPSPRD